MSPAPPNSDENDSPASPASASAPWNSFAAATLRRAPGLACSVRKARQRSRNASASSAVNVVLPLALSVAVMVSPSIDRIASQTDGGGFVCRDRLYAAYNHGADKLAHPDEREMGPSHELDAPPWLRVESTLMATATAIREAYDSRLAPLGLNLSTASLLAYVADFGPVNQSRVAEHLGQGRAVTGTQIDKLESLGLVERRPEPTDRRVWLVVITPGGTELAGAIGDVDRVLRAELREGISDRPPDIGWTARAAPRQHPPVERRTPVTDSDLRTPISPARSAHTLHTPQTPHSKGASS